MQEFHMRRKQHDYLGDEAYFDDPSNPGRVEKHNSIKIFSVFIIFAAIFFQFTSAANINLGTGTSEFGQGILKTTACSGSNQLLIKPASSFVNASGAGSLKFSSIEVSGVPSSCVGSRFTITAFSETSTVGLPLYDSTQNAAVVIMKADNSFVSALGANGISVSTLSSSSFKVTFSVPVSDSKTVYKVAIESSKAACSDGGLCAIGDIGPGGGIIFLTPSSSGNSTGLYFEVAPASLVGTYQLCTVEPTSIPGLLAIGSGRTQTSNLMGIGVCSTSGTGAYAATNYRGGGYSDWFLPTKDEMMAVRTYVSGYSSWSGFYMTSSQNDSRGMWVIDVAGSSCGTGACTDYKTSTTTSVRPVRSF